MTVLILFKNCATFASQEPKIRSCFFFICFLLAVIGYCIVQDLYKVWTEIRVQNVIVGLVIYAIINVFVTCFFGPGLFLNCNVVVEKLHFESGYIWWANTEESHKNRAAHGLSSKPHVSQSVRPGTLSCSVCVSVLCLFYPHLMYDHENHAFSRKNVQSPTLVNLQCRIRRRPL